LTRFSVRHLRPTVAFWLLLSIAGGFAFSTLKYALFPDITFPVVVVTVRSFLDADAPATETDVTGPLEAWLRTVDGVSGMESLTYPGLATVQLDFKVGSDLEKAKRDVEDTLRAADVGRYQQQKLEAEEQAKMQAALRHGMGPAATEEIAKYMNARDAAQAPGKTPPLIYTVVTPVNLNETAVSTYTIASKTLTLDALSRIAERRVANALRAVPGVLRADVLGAPLNGKPASTVRYDGQEVVAVSTIKNANANTLDVADEAERRIAALRATLPDATITRASTQAPYIREASRATTEALLLAVALSVLVIWPFVRSVRATLISALAIPASLLGTALIMRLLGFNLETITLLALALVVGVIVDDAIVMVENIMRHVEEGNTPAQAAHLAGKEIGRALIAVTFTIVAVFAPIGLMSGTLGQFFRPFGITASAAVLLSLLVARSLSPALAAAMLRNRRAKNAEDAGPRYPLYARLLHWALAHRIAVVAIGVVAFLGGLAIIPFIPKGFIPHLDRGEFHVLFAAPPNASRAQTTRIAVRLEEAVRADPAVRDIYTTIGTRAGDPDGGLLDVSLKPERDAKTLVVENRVRARLPDIANAATSVEDVPFVGTDASKPFSLSLTGDDLTTLRAAGRVLERELRATGDYVDMQTIGFSNGRAPQFIQHQDGKRAVTVSADLARNVQIGDASDKAIGIARAMLPHGVSLALSGASADAAETFSSFGGSLALSVVAILVVLFSLFRSWLDPLAIGVALPLSIVGALLALWITRTDFGMISLMGVIFLLGLVNKNAILLVDAIKRERAAGLTRAQAVEAAGERRLRPILMTTFATVLGMLPIALGYGAGEELRRPMGVAIIGGLIASTLLSLIVVPVAYTLFDDLRGPKRVSMNPFAQGKETV
jgi:multidrug efflux pump subunit AcrB